MLVISKYLNKKNATKFDKHSTYRVFFFSLAHILGLIANISIFLSLYSHCRVVSQVEYPSLVDLRGLLLDLVAQLLGALSRIR